MKTSSKKIKRIITALIMLCGLFVYDSAAVLASAENRLKGKILLQVEKNGEAWYVNPANEKRYFLGRPADAFNIMKQLGAGISNADLEKIQIADANLSGADADSDGLSDMIEDALGTDKNKPDTDGDGYKDKDEILGGFNPKGKGKLNINKNFSAKHKGKIFIQVEKNGEAWYINPDNNKRYFLGRPTDAFNVMKSIGLGITDANLNKISVNEEIQPKQEPKIPAEELCEDITISSEFISKDACYNSVAQKTNNKKLCDKIEQQALKDNCYENTK